MNCFGKYWLSVQTLFSYFRRGCVSSRDIVPPDLKQNLASELVPEHGTWKSWPWVKLMVPWCLCPARSKISAMSRDWCQVGRDCIGLDTNKGLSHKSVSGWHRHGLRLATAPQLPTTLGIIKTWDISQVDKIHICSMHAQCKGYKRLWMSAVHCVSLVFVCAGRDITLSIWWPSAIKIRQLSFGQQTVTDLQPGNSHPHRPTRILSMAVTKSPRLVRVI